jgi:5,10-methenyltetrahydromethanopterin hydrogenase
MDNDIDSIDKKINEVANDNLDALEETLDHIDEIDDISDLQDTAKEMVNDCSKDELKKVLKLLIKISRKEEE